MGSIVQMTHCWLKIAREMLTSSEVPFLTCVKVIFLQNFREIPRILFSFNDQNVETTRIWGQAVWSLQINYIKAWEMSWTSFTWSLEVCPVPVVNISLPTYSKQSKPCKLKQQRKLLRRLPEQVHRCTPITPTTLFSPQMLTTPGDEVNSWEKNLNWLAKGSLKRKWIPSQLQ